MYLKQIFLGALGLLFATFAQAQAPKTTANYRVVPLPQEISNTSAGAFALNAQTRIAYPKGNAALQKDAELLAQYLFEATKVRPTLTQLCVCMALNSCRCVRYYFVCAQRLKHNIRLLIIKTVRKTISSILECLKS